MHARAVTGVFLHGHYSSQALHCTFSLSHSHPLSSSRAVSLAAVDRRSVGAKHASNTARGKKKTGADTVRGRSKPPLPSAVSTGIATGTLTPASTPVGTTIVATGTTFSVPPSQAYASASAREASTSKGPPKSNTSTGHASRSASGRARAGVSSANTPSSKGQKKGKKCASGTTGGGKTIKRSMKKKQ
jgi:hypothetical protein